MNTLIRLFCSVLFCCLLTPIAFGDLEEMEKLDQLQTVEEIESTLAKREQIMKDHQQWLKENRGRQVAGVSDRDIDEIETIIRED